MIVSDKTADKDSGKKQVAVKGEDQLQWIKQLEASKDDD